MKILRLQPYTDSRDRYNYAVNYGVWDCIGSDVLPLELLRHKSDEFIESYDIVFMPMFKRWEGDMDQAERLKNLNIKTVLFDNDSCYRSFTHKFYDGIDFIFYRCEDQDGYLPKAPSAHLLWGVDTAYFTHSYGGHGVSFNCTVNHYSYGLRQEISKHIEPTKHTGREYLKHLQYSAAGIHTNSDICRVPRAKLLEFAACGTQIISNRMEGIDKYFPDHLIHYFDSIEELLKMLKSFEPDIKKQKELRRITEERHTHQQRAKEVMSILSASFDMNKKGNSVNFVSQ